MTWVPSSPPCINTFGATWWLAGENDTIGAAQIDQPEFKEALQFYVDLLADAGEDDAANSSYNECTNQMLDSKVAMWVDATVAASNLEADDSPIKGKLGYALSPTKMTDASGWLWAWALAIPENAPDKDAAWEYVALGHRSASTSPKPVTSWRVAGRPCRRARASRCTRTPSTRKRPRPSPRRRSTPCWQLPSTTPATTPRPGLPGVQFVGVPQFQDVGTRCTEEFSAAIAGQKSVDDALAACQEIASAVEGESW